MSRLTAVVRLSARILWLDVRRGRLRLLLRWQDFLLRRNARRLARIEAIIIAGDDR